MRPTGKRLTALLLSLVLGCTAMTGCAEKLGLSYVFAPNTATEPQVTAASEAPAETDAGDSGASADPDSVTPMTEDRTAAIENVVSHLGSQVDVDVVLNRDSEDEAGKNSKTPLSELIRPGDLIKSFTFVFYAGDGVSNIREYKGGCGISVTDECPVKTSIGWYQSDEFIQKVDGSYAEITWQVPENVAPYVDLDGEVQIGYWWGNYAFLNLTNVICTYSRTEQLPVDDTQTLSIGTTLNFSNEATQKVRIPLGSTIGKGNVPQAITFDITGQNGFRKFTGAFGLTTKDGLYMTNTVAVLTDDSHLSLTWIIPPEYAYNVPEEPEAVLGYWWSEAGDITLNSVTVKYSSGSIPRPEHSVRSAAPQEGSNSMNTDKKAAAVAADIKVGWNLGNTLDSYDKESKAIDYETYWGNVKTNKGIFDAMKEKGFNAVRIPVSWTNHLSPDNTIDPAWLNRVQQVVDYAMEDDLYVIINMHHDDYVWLHPVYAEEEAVSSKYVRIWRQIAERFRDYDTRLLFEGMNEPRMVGSANEWTGGTAEERDVINHLLAKFVSTVRESGGKNKDRTLIVTTHAASITEAAINGLVLPPDDNLIISIHNYAPWKFTTKEYPNERRFDNKGKEELNRQFEMLNSRFVSHGIPVIIGEFGAENKDNTSDRTAYYSYYVQTAAKYNIPCFLWDNGLSTSYGIFDRTNNTWFSNGIADAVINVLQ